MNRRAMAQGRMLLANYRRMAMMVFNERVVDMELRGAIVNKEGALEEGDTIDLVYKMFGEVEGVDAAATALLQQVIDAGLEGMMNRGPMRELAHGVTVTVERVLNPNAAPSED